MSRYARPPAQQRWYDRVVVERVLRNWVARRPYRTGIERHLSDTERRILLDAMMTLGMSTNRAALFLGLGSDTLRRVLDRPQRDGGLSARRTAAAARYLRGIGGQALADIAPPVLTGAQYRSIIDVERGAPEMWEVTTHAILTGTAAYAPTGS